MKFSERGLHILKDMEGFRASPYKDSAGKMTVGYGHLITEEDRKLNRFESPLTEAAALELLRKDILWAEQACNRFITVPLFSNQFDAVVCFTFNCGVGALIPSTLLKKINARVLDVSSEFLKWCKVRNPTSGELEVNKGLLNRRKQEATLWNEVI